MKTKISLLALLMGFFNLTGAMAQTDATEAATKVAKEYAATLSFSEEQITQAKKIFKTHLDNSRENWNSTDGDVDAFNLKQKETFKETDSRIKAMLNDDQLAVYKEKRDDLKQRALDKYLGDFLGKE